MKHHEDNLYAIVADIGGTFACFSRVNLNNLQMDKIEIYPCADFISLEAVLLAYKTQHTVHEIKRVAIAIACPVIGIYIAGGIVPSLLLMIQKSDFNALIPTYIITAEQPGILGAAVYLKQSLVGEFDVVS